MFSLATIASVPVSTGFTWTTAAVALLNLLVGGVLVAIIKSRPALKKLADEREENLLKERASDMRGMRRRITELEAEQRVDRHTLVNLEQCLDALLMMIELNPERAQEAAGKVRVMRADMKVRQATEKAGLHSAAIGAATEVEE